MSEVKAIEAVDNALSGLTPEEQVRVLSWAQLKYGSKTQPAFQPPPPPSPAAGIASKKAESKPTKKAKSIISMDKSLNLAPTDKKSASQFGSEKAPTNVMQKCVVAVYYLRDIIALEKITVESVYTYFKYLSWPVPSDLKNTLQQAGTSGWLDTADSQDIKLTSLGENLVEHDLPPKAAK